MLKSSNRPAILIVDDAPENINILGELLRDEYDVRVATNAEKAIKIANSDNPPDLILLDIVMPGMDGYTACRLLKAEVCTRDIPVIFITARDSEQDEVKGFECGAVDYVTKPFSPVIVKARVRTHLELKKHRTFLESLSFMDGLTGIPNRRRFDDYLNMSWQFCMRDADPLSLAIVDIDHFKDYNDHYGHQAGDSCLIMVAQCLAAAVKRKIDLVARYGGEEFGCLLPKTHYEDAVKMSEYLREQILALQIPHGYSPVEKFVTVSVGLATMIPLPEVKAEELLILADQNLYKAKQSGRNKVCCSVESELD